MAMIKAKIDRLDQVGLTAIEKANLLAMTADEIERNALDDPDNPPMSAEEMERFAAARLARRTRAQTGLSQSAFAQRFHINAARYRDWEQGRSTLDSVALAYLKVIKADHDHVARALGEEAVGS